MIEIHTHILPNMDDGPGSLEDSLALIKGMMEHGVKSAIATPHHLNEYYVNSYSDVVKSVNMLREEVEKEGLNFKIYPGQEVRLRDDIIERVEMYDIKGLNGSKYILIEFPAHSVPLYAGDILSELRVEGFIPILVHPERISPIQEDIRILQDFINMGCLAQVTASSVISSNKNLKMVSRKMIEERLISFISSGNHDLIRRTGDINLALSKIENLYGSSLVNYYLKNAEKVVKNETVVLRDKKTSKKSFFGRIFRR